MKRKFYLVLITILVLSLALVGCGKKDQESVMKDISGVKQDLKSYESKATMTVNVNNNEQKYYIETWYQAPNYYRIALGNDPKQITQVIVRNDDGIFVVSPQLKKSFRFKGDWAENQGHVYLYHAVLDRILNSTDKNFSESNGNYVFTMKMEPANPLVSKQRVTLNENNLYPQQVSLLDHNSKEIVSVNYDSFKTGVEFKKADFTPEAAMAMAPTTAKPVMAGAKDFGVVEPSYVPSGEKLLEPQETGSSIMLRYEGPKPFTIIEERPAAAVTQLGNGEAVDLWGNTAVVSGAPNANIHSMYWFQNGVEFSLTGQMAISDMIEVARSMVGASGK